MPEIYGSVAAADTYLADRGFTDWAPFSTETKQAALLVASEYVDNTYGALFNGTKAGGRAQERQWPRLNASDIYGNRFTAVEVPIEAEQATYQLALRQGAAPGSLSGDFNASEVIKKAAVEGAVSVEYAGDGSFNASQTIFPVVDAIIAPLLASSSGFSSLSGSRVRV